ncbi:hypothetical protein FACS1894164_20620 [Spirochaetia bacterium]|nr:hypothetical protein FACS1894164_20620 [Spirochaetia bacterium]
MLKKIAVVLIAVFLYSCAGIPRTDPGNVPLAPGALVYCRIVDIVHARKLLDLMALKNLDLSQAAPILDRTDSAFAAFYPKGAAQNFMAVARGTYPGMGANLLFTFSTDWHGRQSRTGSQYWYSESEKIAVSVTSDQVFIADTDPLNSGYGTQFPEQFITASNNTLLGLWFEKMDLINDFLMKNIGLQIQVPAEHIFVLLHEVPAGYEITFLIKTQNTTYMRALQTILAMAKPHISALDPADTRFAIIKTLFDNPPAVRGYGITSRIFAIPAPEVDS